jgi:hypothetical protein
MIYLPIVNYNYNYLTVVYFSLVVPVLTITLIVIIVDKRRGASVTFRTIINLIVR